MAIDTKLKRSSVQAYTHGLMRPPSTGGGITAAKRAEETWLYAGLTYPAPAPSDVTLYENGFRFPFRVAL